MRTSYSKKYSETKPTNYLGTERELYIIIITLLHNFYKITIKEYRNTCTYMYLTQNGYINYNYTVRGAKNYLVYEDSTWHVVPNHKFNPNMSFQNLKKQS